MSLLLQHADEKAKNIFDLAKTHQVTVKPGACKKCGHSNIVFLILCFMKNNI